MGDKEFEDYLQGQENDHHEVPECQKKLLYDIIQQKMCNSTDLIGIYSELMIRFPTKKIYEKEVAELQVISKQAFEQLDYLMSVVLEEMYPDEEEPGK
jgi:hypothetical protein